MFGDIPYSEALDVDNTTTPKYDDAATIYADLFKRLDAAYAKLDASNGSFGSADLYNGGDVAKWKLFAQSLKLKMAIVVADVSSLGSKAKAEAAFTEGVIASQDDNTSMVYLGAAPNTNPLYLDLVASGRHDFVATSTIINPMLATSDPRLPLYYTKIDTVYLGATYGTSSPYDSYSHLTSAIEVPSFECVLFSYEEVEFYLAEAAERGYSVGGNAESHYNAGITASIKYWGGTDADATAFLANAGVAYTTATGTWQEKIATQSWIASFNRGFNGWTTWRRLDFPVFVVPPTPATEDGTIPVRFTYPVNEQTLNRANYEAASSAIGGDKMITKLFWDKN